MLVFLFFFCSSLFNFNFFFIFFPFFSFIFLHFLLLQGSLFNFCNLKIFSTSLPWSSRVLKYFKHFSGFVFFLHWWSSTSFWWSFSHCHLKRDQWIRKKTHIYHHLVFNLIDKPVAKFANILIFMIVQKTFSNHSTPFSIFLFHAFFLIFFVLLWLFRSFALFLFPSFGFGFWLHTCVYFFYDFGWLTWLRDKLANITRALILFKGCRFLKLTKAHKAKSKL